MANTRGFPGNRSGPNPATKFVVIRGPFADGVPDAVVQIGQPWYQWLQTPRLDEAESVQQANHDLHRFRTGYQSVGQSWSTWTRYQQPSFEPEQIRPAVYDLYPYRQYAQAAVQVGQPFWLWTRTQQHVELEQLRPATFDLFQFRQSTVVVQPWFIWRTVRIESDVEVIRQPDNYSPLFFGRSVATPDVVGSTPGRAGRTRFPNLLRVESEADKLARRAKEAAEQRVSVEEVKSDLDATVRESARIAMAIGLARGEIAQLRTQIAELEAQILEEGIKRTLAERSRLEHELLLAQQRLLLIAVQEAVLFEEMEVIDVAFVALVVLTQ